MLKNSLQHIRRVSTALHLISVPDTILNASSGLFLGWDLETFERALACKPGQQQWLKARIVGYTTPSLKDVGGASIRIQFKNGFALKNGGYLLKLRSHDTNLNGLPAIAGVPGNTPDRAGVLRDGLAECIVMGKPARSHENSSIKCTFFPEQVRTFRLGTALCFVSPIPVCTAFTKTLVLVTPLVTLHP
jgi:hypothetical protein